MDPCTLMFVQSMNRLKNLQAKFPSTSNVNEPLLNRLVADNIHLLELNRDKTAILLILRIYKIYCQYIFPSCL